MQPTNTNIGIPSALDLVGKMLVPDNVQKGVVQLQPQFAKISKITDMIGNTELHDKFVFYSFKQGNTRRVEPILSVALTVGDTIATIQYVDSNAKPFRVGDQVTDDATNVVAKVVSSNNGSAVVQFVSATTSTTTTFSSSDFAAAHYCIEQGTNTDTTLNVGRETQLYSPDRFAYAIETITETQEFMINDFHQLTYLDQYKTLGGKPYICMANEMIWLNKIALQLETKMVKQNQVIGNVMNGQDCQMGGFQWQIQNRGGMYVPYTTAPTEDDFINAIENSIKEAGYGGTQEVMCFLGAAIHSRFNKVMKQYITVAGMNNTFGGKEVSGINFPYYIWKGIKLVIAPYELYNDTNLYPTPSSIPEYSGFTRGQGNMLILNTGAVKNTDGTTQPFCTTHKYIAKDMYSWKKGMIGRDGQVASEINDTRLAGASQCYMTATKVLNNPRANVFYECVA